MWVTAMTSNRPAWVLALLLATPWAQAGLGEAQSSVDADSTRMHAQRSVVRAAQYAVHELQMADGSRMRQYVGGNGRVFAVSWTTLYKPNLQTLLSDAFTGYAQAAHDAAKRGGIQRQFHHQGQDLVVQTSGHLQVYTGYAYRPSMLPPGLSAKAIGLG